MNCLGFRRALSVRPASQDSEILSHRLACADCDSFARRQAVFERTLAEAIKVEVPEGLASRILLAHGVRLRGGGRVRRRLAFAASVALGLAAAWVATRPGPLDRAVIAHIDEEWSHLTDRGQVALAQVNRVLAPLGMMVDVDIGPVHYAGSCRIRRGLGAHLVLQGEKGPVTVLLLPDEQVKGRLPVRDGRFRGIIVPAGRGSMAIVGQPDEPLEEIERRLRLAVRFAARDGAKVALGRNSGRGDA